MNSHPSPDDYNMGGSNQFPNMGGPMPGYNQFGQNTSTGQPGNSPGFQDGSNAFFGQMPFPGMYQPQMPLPQDKTELSNEQYKHYVSKCLISVMLNKVQHDIKEQMKMQTFMQQQQFMQNIQNNPNQDQPEGFSGTQTQVNFEVNEKNDTLISKSPKKKKKVSQKKSNKKSSNHGKLVSKTFSNHLQCLYAFVTQSLKKIKTMKVRERSKKKKKLKEKKPKKTKMMSQRLL